MLNFILEDIPGGYYLYGFFIGCFAFLSYLFILLPIFKGVQKLFVRERQ